MNGAYQVQVVQRGIITLPKQLREQANVAEGDTLTLFHLGEGVMVLSSRRAQADAIADKLSVEWTEAGETLESMLSALKEIRTEYDAKKH
ncbi:MAG: AbrB/MazE/SpoVT family DNA-binding domain-containing protein [Acidobacteriota bacterium]|jgi:AbrB family looped-hinge helix DNA binding protein|nr:AbrB/MazE/SpoVT family DNA-binding domain-containing protein [Acidobacteriota bacterium]